MGRKPITFGEWNIIKKIVYDGPDVILRPDDIYIEQKAFVW